MVSAKKSLQGEKSGGLLSGLVGGPGKEDFGMDAVREYLRQTFEQVPPAKQKLLAPLDLLRNIAARYRQQIQDKLMIIGSDTNAADTAFKKARAEVEKIVRTEPNYAKALCALDHHQRRIRDADAHLDYRRANEQVDLPVPKALHHVRLARLVLPTVQQPVLA